MNPYKTYMDRQTISQNAHDKLMALEAASRKTAGTVLAVGTEPAPCPPKKKSFSWQKWGALAACAALLLGLGTYGLGQPGPGPQLPPVAATDPADATPTPVSDPIAPPEGILIQSPTTEGQLNFYAMPALNFQSRSGDSAAAIALPDGSFFVDLTLEDLQKIFWGPDGKPEDTSADLPWVLGWDGYSIRATATYDGNGDLWMLSVYGAKGLDTFELTVSPGQLPPQCMRDGDSGEAADVNGAQVTSYYRAYDRNGDGLTDHICTSEFLVDGYGYRFRNVHTDAGEGEKAAAEAAQFFNTSFVMRAAQGTDPRLYFGHIAHTDNIPQWRQERYTSYADLLTLSDFAPYLPQTEPGGMESFEGYLTYQEGWCNTVHSNWYTGEGNRWAAVYVFLPERAEDHTPVDLSVPESYDVRLYPGAWYDQVPEEYREEFRQPTFRAGDMSLAVVEARWREWSEKGSSGMLCNFKILHDNGVLVEWESEGLTAQEVWALIEPTI